MDFLKEVFEVIRLKEFEKSENDTAVYHYSNPFFSHKNTLRVYAPSNKIKLFMRELYELGLLDKVKEVYMSFWRGNRFRGGGPDRGFIELEEEFAKKVIKEAYFEWIDMGWGHWKGDLRYDLSGYKKSR